MLKTVVATTRFQNVNSLGAVRIRPVWVNFYFIIGSILENPPMSERVRYTVLFLRKLIKINKTKYPLEKYYKNSY